MEKDVAKQAGNNHPTSIPTGVFRTADGYLNLAVTGQKIWERFCHAIERPDLIADPDYATAAQRSKNRDPLGDIINEALVARDSASWIERFNQEGVPSGPINTIDKVFADPQVQHLHMAQTVRSGALGPITLVPQPVVLSETPSSIRVAPPEQGEHTDEILQEFGYAPDEIAAFRRNGTI
jgi:formyl-CoA transferase